MKIIRLILVWFTWGLIACFVGLLASTRVPKVQAWIGHQAEEALGDLLGTKVRVERVDLGLFNRIILDGVVINDRQQQPLLRVHRLSAKLDILDLAAGKVSVSSAQLFGAHVNLYRTDSLSEPNYQFVVDALSSQDTLSDSRLDVHVNSFIMRRSSVAYNQQDVPQQQGVFDPHHLLIDNISAHVILKTLTDDSLNVNVKRLSFREQSGLNVQRLAMKLKAGRRNAFLSQLDVQMPGTLLQLDTLTATYDIDRLMETAWVSGGIRKSTIALQDLSCFVPSLACDLPAITVEAYAEGLLSHLWLKTLNIGSDSKDIELKASGWIGVNANVLSWQLQSLQFAASQHLLSFLHESFELPDILTRMGHVGLQGSGAGNSNGQLRIGGQLTTDVGNVALRLNASSDRVFKGNINVRNVDLGKLLELPDVGKLTTNVDISGTKTAMMVKGNVSQFEYKGYSYNDITLDGSYMPDEIVGKLSVSDPNVEADLEGRVKMNGKKAAVKLAGTILNLTPQALRLSDKWGNATFSADFNADFVGSDVNDAQGTVDLNDFELIDSLGHYHIKNVNVNSGFDGGEHFLNVKGDMGEVRLKGQFDWSTLPTSFVNYIADKLPTMPGLPTKRKHTDNNFMLRAYLSDSEWIKRVGCIPFELQEPIVFQADLNDRQHLMTMRSSIPSFIYDGDHYKGCNILITSPTDSIKCDVSLTKLMENGRDLEMNLSATAADNNLTTTFWWDNNESDALAMSGMLNAVTRLYYANNGKPEAQVSLRPSSLQLGGVPWSIEPCDILYSANRLMVDHFLIYHDSQYLLVDGIASDQPTDTLALNMKDVEVAYVMDLVNFHSVDFAGAATGKINLCNVFDTPKMWADLKVDYFRFEDGRMGTLHAKADWNELEKQIDIHATADDGPDALTLIDGYVSPVREDINLDIRGRGTSIEFLRTYSSSFLSGVAGHAYGDLKLSGPLGNMDLTGKLAVYGQATVDALGTTYQLKGDTVSFVVNDILLNRVRLEDRYGNLAYLSGGIHHDHLSDLTFDLDVSAENLLAYDFRDFGESIFYGTVFANGTVDLHGRPGEVEINCRVTPQPNTTFTYNASSADAISNQDFISWHSKSEKIATRQAGMALSEKPAATSSTDIHINFFINTTADAEMRLLMDSNTNDYITLYGSGGIQASFYNKGTFLMFGTYMIDHGTYGITIQNIIKKNFTFRDGGTIVFGGNPLDANLNMQAVYTVNGVSLSDLSLGNSFAENTVRVNCLMNILGQARAPRVEFDLDMPTVSSDEKQIIRSVIASEQEMNQQVLYLLGIGRFYTQGSNNASTQQTSRTSLAMQSFLSGTVSSQINEVLSQVIKSNDWNFGANISTGNEGWHNAEYEGLISGRMLNNRLLINGQFGYRDNATQANPSFIGDFDIRYLLNPNGNLALKVYNQSNDRYFTRSSMNTQGIGLIMKKDFNGLSDLFHSPFFR